MLSPELMGLAPPGCDLPPLAARERSCDRGHRCDLGLAPPGYDLSPLRGLNQAPRRLVRAGPPDPPVLCERRSPSPRPAVRQLETFGRPNGGVGRPSPNQRPNGRVWKPSPNENKFATKAV